MNISDLNNILEKLSQNFNTNNLAVIIDNVKYPIDDIIVDKDEIIFTIENSPTTIIPVFENTFLDSEIESSLMLVDYNKEKLILTVKIIKDVTGLGLRDAKILFDKLRNNNEPIVIASNLSNKEYEDIKKLFPVGSKFEIS